MAYACAELFSCISKNVYHLYANDLLPPMAMHLVTQCQLQVVSQPIVILRASPNFVQFGDTMYFLSSIVEIATMTEVFYSTSVQHCLCKVVKSFDVILLLMHYGQMMLLLHFAFTSGHL